MTATSPEPPIASAILSAAATLSVLAAAQATTAGLFQAAGSVLTSVIGRPDFGLRSPSLGGHRNFQTIFQTRFYIHRLSIREGVSYFVKRPLPDGRRPYFVVVRKAKRPQALAAAAMV